MTGHVKEMRIMYAGRKDFIHQIIHDFSKFGLTHYSKDPTYSITIPSKIIKQIAPNFVHFPNITIQLYFDVYELVKYLPIFDADLVIVDERITNDFIFGKNALEYDYLDSDMSDNLSDEDVLHSGPQLAPNAQPEIKFERLKSAIEKFTPRHFNYTMKRISVVLPKEARQTEREFTLGLAHVRAVIVDPASSLDLFLFSIQGLLKFYQNHAKTSLCVSGGGLEGYLYSIGVVQALDACFASPKTCRDFDIFSGVSSGAMIASALAADVSSDLIAKQVFRQGTDLEHFSLNTLFDLATIEIIKKGFRLFKAFPTHDLAESIARIQNAIPVGFFRGEKLRIFLENQLKRIGVENNISALKKELYICATDQDTGENVIFGEEPWKEIKISQAVRASTALPTFYLPEKINGHWFSDGQITGGSGFIHAIQKGAGLVVNIDPMVSYTTNSPGAVMKKGGYFTLLQSVKALVQSRANSLLKHSMDRNPDVDFITFQPTDEAMEAMAGNPMKYNLRADLVHVGYKVTLTQILASYEAISHKFGKHGFVLKSKQEIRDSFN